jgi:hypothetical protein
MFRWFKSPLANALNGNLFPRAQKGINVLISIGNKGIFRRRATWSGRFFTEPEKGSLCGCACLERTLQPLTYHECNPQLQLPRSITEQCHWLLSTRPLDTNHPEHAGARDTGKALLCPPSTADSTLDNASLMKSSPTMGHSQSSSFLSLSLSFCFILRRFHNWRSLLSSSLLNCG